MTAPNRPPAPAKIGQRVASSTPTPSPAATAAPVVTPPPPAAETTATNKVQGSTYDWMQKNWDEEAVIAEIVSGNHFIPNPANAYNNLTYDFKLFCMTPNDYLHEKADGDGDISDILEFYAKLDSYKQVIVADSGVTGYNITSVEIDSVFSGASRASTSQNITMKIVEPNGVSFLDSLQLAAEEAKVQNYMDFYYFLELNFKGYDRIGQPSLTPFPNLENGGRWLWAVRIQDIDVNLNTGGGQYTLNMLSVDSDVVRDTSEYGQVLDTTTVQAETVGEFLDQLATKLSNSWYERTQQEGAVKYSFVCHGIPTPQGNASAFPQMTGDNVRSMTLRPDEENLNPIRGDSMSFIKPDEDNKIPTGTDGVVTPTANIPRGTYIPDVINLMMSSCKEAQNLSKNSRPDNMGPDQSADAVNAEGHRQSVTWQMIPEVRLKKEYDLLSNRYNREIVWHIYPRISQDVILSDTQIKQASEPKTQKAMLAALAARGFLPKKYDYLFTGLNTEITNFDMNFNLTWAVTLPRFQNYYTDQALDHAQYNKNSSDIFGNVVERNALARANQDRAHQDFVDTFHDVKKEETVGGLTPEQQAANKKLLTDKIAVSKAAQQLAQRTAKELADARKVVPANTAPPLEQDYSRSYTEDLLDERARLGEDALTKRFRPVPINRAGGNEAKETVGNGMPSQYHAGKTLYGAILNQVYGVAATNFQEIDLSIRGDPFWIGRGTFELALAHKKEIVDGTNVLNTLNGTNCILLEFKYPSGVDSSGRIELSPNAVVSGLYQIVSVKSVFNNGSLAQTLHGTRKPLFDHTMALLGINAPVNDEKEPKK